MVKHIFPSFCNYRGMKCRPTLVTASTPTNCNFRTILRRHFFFSSIIFLGMWQ